ncbi:MAG: phosphotransferase [Gammaproteobacteria bacterium]
MLITPNEWQQLCDQYQIGRLLVEPQSISGGLLHKVYRLVTTTGVFAAKLLNPDLLRAPNWKKRWLQTEQIAHLMMDNGIPTVCALPSAQGIITSIDEKHFLVFPWINGKTLIIADLQSKQAHQIGEVLAKMHQVNVPLDELAPFIGAGYTEAHWKMLKNKALQQQLPWAAKLSEALPNLVRWSQQAAQTLPLLGVKDCVAHRDFDPKNVIWQDNATSELKSRWGAGTPIIIDWEYAGLISSDVDLLTVALNWSITEKQQINKILFLAVLSGYRRITGALPTINEWTVWAYFGYCLEWLEFNVQRALQRPEDLVASQEIEKSLRILSFIEEQLPLLLTWVNE